MLLWFTRSAQLVICCETCPKTKSKLYRQLLVATGRQAVNTAHMHRQGLTVPSRKCIRRNLVHCFFWFDQIDGKRSIGLEFVESNPTRNHRIFESIAVLELYIQGHTLRCWCEDSFCSMMVDCMSNRNRGNLLCNLLGSLLCILRSLRNHLAGLG